MAELKFGQIINKTGSAGVSRGVIYRAGTDGKFNKAETWDGLTKVTTSPEGGEAQDFYADNSKYLTLRGAENLKFTIEAFRFPPSFAECDGTKQLETALPGMFADNQARATFCFSWTTTLVNAASGLNFGEEIHIVYMASASPSSQDNSTLNDSPDLKQFSWECSTTPVPVPGMSASAHLTFRSVDSNDKAFKALKGILYGTSAKDAYCPLPEELIPLLKTAATT